MPIKQIRRRVTADATAAEMGIPLINGNNDNNDNSEQVALPPEGTVVEKAYEIDLSRLEEGFMSDTIMCFAENINIAKSKLLAKIRYESWILRGNGKEVNYLNIPVKRLKEADKVVFEGKIISKNKIPEILAEIERNNILDNILNNPDIKYCYISKGGYYRPNSCGYTSLQFEAGVYTKEEAVKEARSVREIRLIPIDISQHNKMLCEKMQELISRIIT